MPGIIETRDWRLVERTWCEAIEQLWEEVFGDV